MNQTAKTQDPMIPKQVERLLYLCEGLDKTVSTLIDRLCYVSNGTPSLLTAVEEKSEIKVPMAIQLNNLSCKLDQIILLLNQQINMLEV